MANMKMTKEELYQRCKLLEGEVKTLNEDLKSAADNQTKGKRGIMLGLLDSTLAQYNDWESDQVWESFIGNSAEFITRATESYRQAIHMGRISEQKQFYKWMLVNKTLEEAKLMNYLSWACYHLGEGADRPDRPNRGKPSNSYYLTPEDESVIAEAFDKFKEGEA